MAVDASGSVDEREYDLQMGGVAGALGDPEVVEAILAIPDVPVALSIFEWSSTSYQRIVQDWVLIEDRPALDRVRKRLAGWRREPAPEATGLGAAPIQLLSIHRALVGEVAHLEHTAPGCAELISLC